MRELRETIDSLQKEVKRHDSVVTSQQQEGQPSELSAEKLYQRVVELERENAHLQVKLAESERTKQGYFMFETLKILKFFMPRSVMGSKHCV